MISSRLFFLLALLLLLAGCRHSPAITLPQTTPTPLPTRGVYIPLPTPVITPSPGPTPEKMPAFGPFNSPEYGVQAFMWWKPDTAERDLQLIKEMGFGWVKQSIAWRDIETIEKGSYDWWRADNIVELAENAGIKLLIRLDRQPFWSQPAGTEPTENMPPANLQDFRRLSGFLQSRTPSLGGGWQAARELWARSSCKRQVRDPRIALENERWRWDGGAS